MVVRNVSTTTAPKITYVTLFADESIHPRYEAALQKFTQELGRRYPMYIGESEVRSKAGEFEHRSPIDTKVVVGYFQVGTAQHAREAIEEAAKSFASWSETPWRERVRIMRRAAHLVDERKVEIAPGSSFEGGENPPQALAGAWGGIDAVKDYAKGMGGDEGY